MKFSFFPFLFLTHSFLSLSLPFISPTLFLSSPLYSPMTLSENDQQEESFMRFQSNMNRHPSKTSTSSTTPLKKKRTSSQAYSTNNNAHASTPQTNSNEFSWPILLAIVPTLGTFFAGSAEIWSDFVMILLILYYVYKWMTGKTPNCLQIQ